MKVVTISPFKVLKWLRFLGGAICGRTGTLSTTPTGEAANYEVASIPQDSLLYYFLADGLPRFVDPSAMKDRQVTSSATTDRQVGFRKDIAERDKTCIITGSSKQISIAAHIIPHPKGDAYIRSVSQNRLPEDAPAEHHILDIDNIRNGLLLFSGLHTIFALSIVAFLKTPNFALSPNDIPSVSPVNTHNRLTLQHFGALTAPVQAMLPPNQDARQPPVTNNWPPDFIFDFAYVCAALTHWGPESSIDLLHKAVKAYYYDGEGDGSQYNPHENESVGDEEGQPEEDAGDGHAGQTGGHGMERRSAGRTSGGQQRSEGPPTNERKARKISPATEREKMMDILHYIWSQSASEKLSAQRMRAEAENREKVKAWLGQEPCNTNMQGAGSSTTL